MLLIEGPDMIGKTTLCRALLREMRPTRPVGSDSMGLAESRRMVEACTERIVPWTIMDRCWISEIVYGSRCRGGPAIAVPKANLIAELAAKVGALIVVIYADDDVYAELVDSWWTPEQAFSKDDCRRVNAAYRHLALSGRLDDYAVKIDIAVNIERVLSKILYPAERPGLVAHIAAEYERRQQS